LTIADVAARIGVSQAYVSNIETGRKSPTAKRVLQISEVLQVDPDELLCRAGMIAGDLAAIIRKRPKVRAAMLRAVDGGDAEFNTLMIAVGDYGRAPECIRRAIAELRRSSAAGDDPQSLVSLLLCPVLLFVRSSSLISPSPAVHRLRGCAWQAGTSDSEPSKF
jgi:transcriptional regulator with XRE-family HTH domain